MNLSRHKSLVFFPFLLSLLVFVLMACDSVSVNVQDTTPIAATGDVTPTIAFTSDGLATRPPSTSTTSQSDGSATLPPATFDASQSDGLATRPPVTSDTSGADSTVTPTRSAATKRSATPTRGSVNGYQTIAMGDLPPEAQATMQLILQGGPFPYRQDGVVFQNREGILPKQKQGYYHEYTVVTPGSSDRGARRIIAGVAGEYYYTDDHYSSFKVILINE